MTKVTLLSKEDLEGKIFQKLGRAASLPTDFAWGRYYWTKTLSQFNVDYNAFEFFVASAGKLSGWTNVIHDYGVRPVLIPDNFDEIAKEQKIDDKGIGYVSYGEWPSKKLDIQEKLIGKTYTVPELPSTEEQQFQEYVYDGKKYICKDNEWFEVTPIEWIVDEKNRRLISKYILFNAPLNYKNPKYDGCFETSSLYNFLNNEFINEIIPSNPVPQAIQEYTQDNLDTEIARLEAEIAAKQELITRIELLTAETEALDSELAALGIDPNKGTAYTIKPQSQNSKVPSGKQ